MRKGRFLLTLITVAVITQVQVRSFAQSEKNLVEPSFPACSSPQGDTRVVYTTGVHGIPGDTGAYTGSDAVYNLTADTLTQCFCSENGDGIQTNWWKVSSLSLDEIEILQNDGWIYIPNGALWGLEEDPYMAYNDPYACGPQDDDDDGDDDDDDDGDDDNNNPGGRGGQILGASTFSGGQVLGLASTGNIKGIASLAVILGLTLSYIAYALIRLANEKKE